jgi:hypothetical protein
MPSDAIHSDQLYNWSANERFHCRLAPSAPSPGPTIGQARASHPSGIPHRALQTVRPCRLQMSAGTGTRAQILPLRQSGRRPPRDGLRPGGIFPAGLGLLEELPESPSGAGADLQYQPQVVRSSSQVLTTNAHGAFILISARPRIGWDPRRQLSAELVARRLCFAPSSKERDLR